MKGRKSRLVYLICKMHFDAAHRLHNPHLSEEENQEIYGPCNNPNGHGHNYILEVCIKGNTAPKTGFLMDLGKLKSIINHEIIQYCDHKNLNCDVPWLKNVIPTAENLAIMFWDRLADKIREGRLYKIRLHETATNIVEYMGE